MRILLTASAVFAAACLAGIVCSLAGDRLADWAPLSLLVVCIPARLRAPDAARPGTGGTGDNPALWAGLWRLVCRSRRWAWRGGPRLAEAAVAA